MNALTYEKHPLRPGYVLRSSYRISRVLGSGGFAVTYLACHVGLDHQVAIKEYLPADAAMRAADGENVLARPGEDAAFEAGLSRFTEEARTLASFDHRGIVSVADIFECNGTAYMALEYVDGEGLASLLDRVGTLDEARLRAIVKPVLEALQELHDRDILHRDIKPENIQLRSTGCPVLIDFGNSRSMTARRDAGLPVMVTPGYAPIEQYMSNAEEGPWTDIYALAATLHRAITGVTPPDAMARVLEDKSAPARGAALRGYSPTLLSTIDRALSMRPGRRPQSIAELRSLLDAPADAGRTIIPTDWIEDVPSAPIEPGLRSKPPILPRLALAATLFAATITGAFYLDWSGRREAEAVRVAAELSRKAIERARLESAQRRETARWERVAQRAASAYAQSREAEIARQRTIEAARRETLKAERRRLEAAKQRRLAEATRIDERRRAQRRLTKRQSRADRNPLSGLRRLFLGAVPR